MRNIKDIYFASIMVILCIAWSTMIYVMHVVSYSMVVSGSSWSLLLTPVTIIMDAGVLFLVMIGVRYYDHIKKEQK